MKSSSSSSSSSFSISSSSSFFSNPFSSKTQTFGCISGILRRFFCSGSLPTYPSDQIVEKNSKICVFHQESKSRDAQRLADRGYGPGVVARLMGLDSMPDTNPESTRIVCDSITRSRSMNSVDCFRKESNQLEGRHRRVKSTLGLRQVPDFIELEDENFFILSFEHKGSGIREFGLNERNQQRTMKCNNRRRTEKDRVVVKQRKTGEQEKFVMQTYAEGKENDNENALNAAEENPQLSQQQRFQCDRVDNSVGSDLPLRDENLVLVEAKQSKRKKKKKKKEKKKECPVGNNEEHECGGQADSSPVSVLDFDRFFPVEEARESEISLSMEPSLRRQLSPELEANKHNHETVQEDKIAGKFDECNNDYSEVWLEICRITEAQIEESKWVHKEVTEHEDFEEINKDFVSYIVDQMLEETVVQLANFTRV